MNARPDDVAARHHRQSLLPGIGPEGQARLRASRALLVGCGALGCVTADAICRAGVGRITIVDRDIVELTNLQRQILFDERDAAAGAPKAEAARRRLGEIDSSVAVNAVVDDFNHRNAERIASEALGSQGPRVILDGTDNFETRYLLNDLAVKLNVPYIYAGVVGTTGMQMTVLPGVTPCLRCVFDQAPPAGTTATCDTAGVLGPAVSIVAGFQAAEAIKALVGAQDSISRSLLMFDVWANELRRIDVSGARASDCPCCAERTFVQLDGADSSLAASLCGRSMVQVLPQSPAPVDLAALARRLAPVGAFSVSAFLLKGTLAGEKGDAGEPIELTVFPNGRALIRGVTRPERARSLYAKYVGA